VTISISFFVEKSLHYADLTQKIAPSSSPAGKGSENLPLRPGPLVYAGLSGRGDGCRNLNLKEGEKRAPEAVCTVTRTPRKGTLAQSLLQRRAAPARRLQGREKDTAGVRTAHEMTGRLRPFLPALRKGKRSGVFP